MTLGKKIGGGFCLILLLTLILGLVTFRAMKEAETTSINLAEDRVPRLLHYSEMQNNLLLGAYFARVFTNTRDQNDRIKALEYIDKMKAELDLLRDLNKTRYNEDTEKFQSQFGQDITQYENMIRQSQERITKIQELQSEMLRAGDDTQRDIQQLIVTMTQTLKSFSDAGNADAVAQYSTNISDATAILCRVSSVIQDMLVAERDAKVGEFSRLRQLLPAIAKDFRLIEANLLRQECKDLCQATLQSYEYFSRYADEVAQLQGENTKSNSSRIAMFFRMLKASDDIANLSAENTTITVRDGAASLSNATTVTLVLIIAVLAIGIIAAFLMTRTLVKPLAETQRFAEEVAAGNLSHELAVHTNDETGKLADALRSMVAALRKNIAEAQQKSEQAQKATKEAQEAMAKAEEAAKQAERAKREGMLDAAERLEGMVEIISSASTELSAQIEQSDYTATESAQRLQEAATAMNEMNATVQEVARNAGSASTASGETKNKAEAGEHVVHQVVQSIGEVQAVSMQLKEDMAKLNESAQDISRIMSVISDIADQTNLLALNAAIEAARAGEAGRGFAVVADEVRKLAEKTMTSTLDVSNAIRSIQESTDMSMSAMDKAVERVNDATELANQSGSALEEIVATVEATSDQVQAIAAASEEQSAASEEINRSILEVNDMSHTTASAMAEASKAVAELAHQASRLKGLIKEMKNS